MNSSNPDDVYRRGLSRLVEGDFPGAVADLTEALRINPGHAQAYNNRGVAFLNQGNYPAATADFTEALRVNPGYAAAYNNRGLAFLNQGDYTAATADFDRALRIDPSHAAHNNRGLAFLNQGDYRAALADFNQALRLNPGYADAHNNRGAALYSRGDLAAAAAEFAEALRLNPQYSQAYSNRGGARCLQGDLAGGLADLDQALRLDPRNADAYGKRGWARFDRGDFPGAVADFDEVVRLRPGGAEAQSYRDYAARLARENRAGPGPDEGAPPQREAAAGSNLPTPFPREGKTDPGVVNGATWRETIFLLENTSASHFTTPTVALGEFFQKNFTPYEKCEKRDLPLFAFNKRPDSPLDPSNRFHAMDFTKNDVHILVTELDCWRAHSLGEKLRQDSYHIRRHLGDALAGEYDRLHAYALEVWRRLKQDPRVLFTYLTPSGLGLRFALHFHHPIRSAAAYRAAYLHWSWQFLQQYDAAGLLKIDVSLCRGLNYWFVPTSNHVYVNESCQSL